MNILSFGMKKIFFFTLLIFFLSWQAQAQSLKYKDIYTLLEQEQYETALPGLATFLSANPDHPSATIYMGVIAQEFEKDCAKAKTYFEKALTLIDQKELNKNKKYYGLWNRRNLRTGKYGITLDDVRLDVENRVNNCSDKN